MMQGGGRQCAVVLWYRKPLNSVSRNKKQEVKALKIQREMMILQGVDSSTVL